MAALIPTPKYTLRDMRERANVSLHDASRAAYVDTATLKGWEDGHTGPSLVELERLLHRYGYRFDQLETTPYVEPVKTAKLTLQEMRLASNVPASEASRVANVSYRSLRNWETGVNIPSIVHTNTLLALYGYTLDQLELAPFLAINQEREQRIAEQRKQRRTRTASI